MTYGFGLWRSGYTTLIPWHWSWPSDPDPFDYLRGRFSGCGQRVDNDAEVIPAVYWSCFREGYDDARYVYTLQQAIVEREGSKDPACLAAVTQGRRILQETWDAIHVQPKYLAEGMWPSEEFDAIRWRLASQTETLLKYPAARKAMAFAFDVLGTGAVAKGSHTVAATLEEAGGMVRADLRQDLANPPWIALPLPAIPPGVYTLRLKIRNAAGKQCSGTAQTVTTHAGPLY